MRFKCACNQWRSMIEDPTFVDSHRIRSHVRPGGIDLLHCLGNYPSFSILHPDGEGNLVPLQFPGDIDRGRYDEWSRSRYSYEDSLSYWKDTSQVEGLVCFGDSYIWNPSTRKITRLPPQDITLKVDLLDLYSIIHAC